MLSGDLHTFFSSKAFIDELAKFRTAKKRSRKQRSLALAASRRSSGLPASFVVSDGNPSVVGVKVRYSRSGFLSAAGRE